LLGRLPPKPSAGTPRSAPRPSAAPWTATPTNPTPYSAPQRVKAWTPRPRRGQDIAWDRLHDDRRAREQRRLRLRLQRTGGRRRSKRYGHEHGDRRYLLIFPERRGDDQRARATHEASDSGPGWAQSRPRVGIGWAQDALGRGPDSEPRPLVRPVGARGATWVPESSCIAPLWCSSGHASWVLPSLPPVLPVRYEFGTRVRRGHPSLEHPSLGRRVPGCRRAGASENAAAVRPGLPPGFLPLVCFGARPCGRAGRLR
jgi:hypothetical protein